jgi:hypothetical protein
MRIRRETSGADGQPLDSQEAFCYTESINYKIKWVNKLPIKRPQDIKDKMRYCYGLTRRYDSSGERRPAITGVSFNK